MPRVPFRFIPLPLALILVLGWASFPIAAYSAEDFATARLKRLKIEPTRESVESFLQSLISAQEHESEVQKLIDQLGHPHYTKRQSAMLDLLRLPIPPIALLQKATHSTDAEIRARARRLLVKLSQKEFRSKIAAVLNYIDRHEVKGLTGVILEVLSRLEEPYLIRYAERALRATAEPQDVDLLRKEIATAASPRREAAVLALGTALGTNAQGDLLPLLEHADPGMRLAAAFSLADFGERRCLAVLLDLLEADDAGHRHQSAWILRSLTGQRFSYSAGGEEEARKASVIAWRNWHREHGATARLLFPIPRRHEEVGQTLVCVWASNEFREVSAEKENLFTVSGFKYVWGCHAAEDGRRLVVDAVRKIVCEYDGTGRETWRRINLPGRPTSVEGLDNGNVLIACSDSNQVVEVARDGRIVWDFKIEGRPTTAQRLDNGNTVINLQTAGEVVEVDPQGNRTVLVKGLDRSHTAQRLENGNVLVTEMARNRVDEYDVKGNLVWTRTGLRNPAQAQRLSSGNTLIADEEGLHEFDPENNRIWHLPVTRARFFRY